MILVVDDEPAIRQMLEIKLGHHGFPTVAAGSVKETMEILRSGVRPCLVLLDIMMPGLTGWDLIERLTREPMLADIPIKFMSANPIAIQAYRRAGGARISLLPKPLDQQRLLLVARAYCGCRVPLAK